jgi:aspartokinase-like uncharacterized kinase
LLVVPGGGEFADQVRKAYRQYNLDETTAHCMALLAMDQFGYLLSRLIAGSALTSDLTLACRAAESGRVAVILPSALLIHADPLPRSWKVTSDSIAAWIACQAGCKRLVLLKDVDGLLAAGSDGNPSRELIAELTVRQLAGQSGGVDEHLPVFLTSTCLDTWVINGEKPGRLSALLDSSHTTGTHITAAAK